MAIAEAVIFDFGGVLIDWNPNYLYDKLIPDPDERRWFLEHVCSPKWNYEQDAGRPIAEALAEKIAEFPHYELWIRAFYERHPELLRGAFEDSVALLEALDAASVPLYGLTNWSAETFPHAEAQYPFLRRFRYIAVSGRLKIAKPDPRIYQHLLHVIARPAARCVFIDDNLANVESARGLGLQAIHHVSAAKTAHALRALGLQF
jgi:2-haloacid dehalogenase